MRKRATGGIVDYFTYIKSRIKYIKSGVLLTSVNEYHYYTKLWKEILNYANSHKIYFKYLTDEIDLYSIKRLIGFSERHVLRYLRTQRLNLIQYINSVEDSLLLEYPFENGEQRIAEVEK